MPRFILDEKLRRTVYDLDKDVLRIGRALDNDITILDLKASRHHCIVERHEGTQFVVVDLGSQNGTRVNEHLVDRTALKAGDAIRIGEARVWFDHAPPPDAPSDSDANITLAGSPVSTVVPKDRLERLHRVSKALNSELHLDRVLEIIMDHVVELTGAERGFLVLEGDGDRPEARVARNYSQEDVPAPEAEFSASIARQAMRRGSAVMLANAVEDSQFADTLSVHAIKLRSVMALPFSVRGRNVGAVYVDNNMQRGAFGEVEKEMLESLMDLAGAAIERARLFEENEKHRKSLEIANERLEVKVETTERELSETRDRLRTAGEPEKTYPNIVGESGPMREVLRLLDKIVKTEEPVLVMGESGTGKELIARAVHHNGPRAKKPFLSENCAALPDNLLESELFGHVRGAFTGADRDKKGLFELADTGTLFLDEVGDMSPEMQKRLLRALQEGEIRPVGGKSIRKVDVRIISASNKDLERLVRAGEFREDLYYRLRVLTIRLPPLRDRREDVPILLDHFRTLHAAKHKGEQTLGSGVMDALLAYDWPGNIRELENEVKRMLSLGEDVILTDVLSEQVRRGGVLRQDEEGEDDDVRNLIELVERVERREIAKALRLAEGNKTRASEMLGISRFTLQRKLEKYDVTE